MDKQELIKRLTNSQVAEYGYMVFFVCAFIVSLVLVIRPSVTTLFTLHAQLDSLKDANIQYTQAIATVNKLQSLLQSYQDDFHLLDEAMPKQPALHQIIYDLSRLPLASGSAQPVDLPGITVGTARSTKIKKTTNTPYTNYSMQVKYQGDYAGLQDLISAIHSQRRIKTIKSMTLGREQMSSASAQLTVQLEVEVYHL